MTTTKKSTLDLVYIGMFVAIITICAYITIPATVPFTMQTFGVFAAIAILGWRRGTLAFFVYLLLGCVGAPVFSGFKGGAGVLFGVTGGYLIGFLIAAIVSGGLIKFFGRKFLVMFFSMVLGLILCYAFGTAWFMYLYAQKSGAIGLMSALSMCVFPFVIPDLIKIVLAILLGNRLRPLLPSDILE